MTEITQAPESLAPVAHPAWADAYLLANKLFPVTNYGLDLFVMDATLTDPPQNMAELAKSRLSDGVVERMLSAKQALHSSHGVTSGQFFSGEQQDRLQEMWRQTTKSVSDLLQAGGCSNTEQFEPTSLLREQVHLARECVSPTGALHAAQVDRLILLREQLTPGSVSPQELEQLKNRYGGKAASIHTIVEHIVDSTRALFVQRYGQNPAWYKALGDKTLFDSAMSTY